MESLYLLIPVALIFAVLIVWLLIWAVNRGQYDDLDKDAWRALNDDLDTPEKGHPERPAANRNSNEGSSS